MVRNHAPSGGKRAVVGDSKSASIAAAFCVGFETQSRSKAAPTISGNRGGAPQGRDAMKRRTVLAGLGATAAVSGLGCRQSSGRSHRSRSMVRCSSTTIMPSTKALTRFGDLVQKYYGEPVNFTLHKNSSLGLEKQYFEYMAQGKAVDYGIVRRPTCRRSQKRRRSSMLLRFQGHRTHEQGRRANILEPIADEVATRAEVVLIGYAGGGVRNIFANRPLRTSPKSRGSRCGCRARRYGRGRSPPPA